MAFAPASGMNVRRTSGRSFTAMMSPSAAPARRAAAGPGPSERYAHIASAWPRRVAVEDSRERRFAVDERLRHPRAGGHAQRLVHPAIVPLVAHALVDGGEVRAARAGVRHAADVVARDAPEPALADDLLAGGDLLGVDRQLADRVVGHGPFEVRERFGEEADVRLAVLRHAELHPRPGPAAIGEHRLQPRRARLVPDAGEQRRPHVVGVLGLLEQPHLVGEFGRDAALAVAAVAVEAVEARGARRGRGTSGRGVPAPVRPVLEERGERGALASRRACRRAPSPGRASRRYSPSRPRSLISSRRGKRRPAARGLPPGSIAWQLTQPFRTASFSPRSTHCFSAGSF